MGGEAAPARRISAVEAELGEGFAHGEDVGGRDVGLDVVDGVEDPSPAGRERFDVAADVVADLVGRAVRENVLGLDASAPEADVGAEVLFRAAGSIPAAEMWAGFRMSTPTSMKSGMIGRTDPQEWKKSFASGKSLWTCSWTTASFGLTRARKTSGLTSCDSWVP